MISVQSVQQKKIELRHKIERKKMRNVNVLINCGNIVIFKQKGINKQTNKRNCVNYK